MPRNRKQKRGTSTSRGREPTSGPQALLKLLELGARDIEAGRTRLASETIDRIRRRMPSTPKIQIGVAVRKPEQAHQQEIRRLLEATLRHSDRLARRRHVAPREAAKLLGVEAGLARVERTVAALSFLAEMFAEVAAYAAQAQPSGVLEAAQRRGELLLTQLVATGQLVPSGALTKALGITRQALNKAVQARRIFALERGGENYYPAFYADPALERRRVEIIAKRLGDASGWDKWLFFTTPKASLGRRTPVLAMIKGEYDRVLRAASAHAER